MKSLSMFAGVMAVLGGFAAEPVAEFWINGHAKGEKVRVESVGGKLKTIYPSNFNGRMFEGWKEQKSGKIYGKWEPVEIAEDSVFSVIYKSPVDLAKWEKDSTGEPKALTVKDKPSVYAIGDSITFGRKVLGNGNGESFKYSWAGIVAAGLGADKYINDASSGSRLAQWRSVLTQSNCHNQFAFTQVGGASNDVMTARVKAADLVLFTLGVNDVFFHNTPSDVVYRMTEFLDAIHQLNPSAKICVVGFDESMRCFRKGRAQADLAELEHGYNEHMKLVVNGPVYRDFAAYVDCSDIFSADSCYDPCSGKPDDVHPGYIGNTNIAARVLTLLGKVQSPRICAVNTSEVGEGSVTVSVNGFGIGDGSAQVDILSCGKVVKSVKGLKTFDPVKIDGLESGTGYRIRITASNKAGTNTDDSCYFVTRGKPADAATDWCFDAEAGTLSGGGWTFKAEKKSGGIAVGASCGTPGKVAPLDFTRPVFAKGDLTSRFMICELVPDFGSRDKVCSNGVYVGRITLPRDGLVKLADYCFAHCKDASGDIVFPDSLEHLGVGVFQGTGITSARFGAGIKSVATTYGHGAFTGCSALTNVTFAADGNVVFEGKDGILFAHCPALETLDLSGVRRLTCGNWMRSFVIGSKSLKKIVLKAPVTLSLNALYNNTAATEIEVFGGEPELFDGKLELGNRGSKLTVK